MKNDRSRNYGHRFPSEIISYAVRVYYRFCLSFRDVEDLLAERGIIVSYETIRLWRKKFGPDYARKLKRRQGRFGDIWHWDEVFIRINGQQQYLCAAVQISRDLAHSIEDNGQVPTSLVTFNSALDSFVFPVPALG
jgi:transposase-like protein